jgi:hypothetical protein
MTVVFLHLCLIRAVPLTNVNEPKIKNDLLQYVNIRLGWKCFQKRGEIKKIKFGSELEFTKLITNFLRSLFG